MSEETRVDTERLRQHVPILHQERKLAAELSEHLKIAKALADDVDAQALYASVERKAERLEDYFSGMSRSLEEIADIFDDLHLCLTRLMREDQI